MVETSHRSGFLPSLADPFRSLGARVADWFAPASEASADDGGYRISMEVPGVADSDIDVTLHEGVVTVTGRKQSTRTEKGETWFFSEREFGSFSRSFRLPPDADGDRIGAALKDGVLVLSIPKRGDTAPEGARKVAIEKG
ncbi:Hsp20/alpha crystallin family protein [Roseicyclus persicicus]|uniref:Hsp20/alpha crystallin family protein n=1 Tax=Roseicyclus persicicus TaxID=2650661 RepID=A0A7X6JYC8_9RHOB|nr:Hsp20/alpha crystallin family protein [Roseibacterium persicicum]NKX43945.1 Hsp20/alpha crystallin family protein [Roseibacterium persicicum]